MMIDLRSDTLTKPSKEMLEAMMAAKVGDDVYQEDPTVNELEEKAAKILNMEAALYCPSGTMTNQIAIRLSTKPQDEVICHKYAHVYLYEAGGIASNSHASVKLLDGDRGILTSKIIEENISADDVHAAPSALVCLENTMNKGGGSIYTLDNAREISDFCKASGLKLHLDGARLFNAMIATNDDAKNWGPLFDTISICLSKGLGAPVGSLLLSSQENIKHARKIRKSFGGGMRQAGYLAAAGIYALDNNIERLSEDHRRATEIGKILESCSFVESVLPVETNIVIFRLLEGMSTVDFINSLSEKNIKASPFSNREIRFVTHLDFDDAMLYETVKVLKVIK
jgi:threonine aldolase